MLQLDKINAYYGESHILRDVSFTIDSGEVVCLMGRNGVGKTTTLKVLTGLLPARTYHRWHQFDCHCRGTLHEEHELASVHV